MIKGVIFDLDGTLIDSMGVWYEIDRKFLRENGVSDPPADISDRVKKLTVAEAAELFIGEFGISRTPDEIISRIEELVRAEYAENIPLKAGAAELLDLLDRNGIPYGVATATYKSLAEAVLRRCGILHRFAFVLTDREYPNGKSFPDIFLGGAELLGTSPAETLVVEDSLHCVETAEKAGFVTAAVYDEAAKGDRYRIEQTADFYFMSLDEVGSLIKQGR